MLQMILGLLLRHALTLLSGYLLSKGVADASATDAIIGGISAAAGLGLSALNKVAVVGKIDAAVENVAQKAGVKVSDFDNLNK